MGIEADLYHVRSLIQRQKVLDTTQSGSEREEAEGGRKDTQTGRREVSQFNLSGLTSYAGKK